MNPVNTQLSRRSRILGCAMPFIVFFMAVGAFYTYVFYGLNTGRISSPTRSPNGKFVASIVHYGDWSSVAMEASGIHPFGIGRDEVYQYDVEDGWITGLTWRDNQTLIVTFLFHKPPASLPSRRWQNINVLFQRDTSGTGPL